MKVREQKKMPPTLWLITAIQCVINGKDQQLDSSWKLK